MYQKTEYAETSLVALRQLIRDNSLGQITTAIAADGFPLIQSTHIPWIVAVDDEASETDKGRLLGHMAKSNPQVKAMIQSVEGQPTDVPGVSVLKDEVLVVFTSNVQHYVTPRFYTESKPTTAKVVPTWNYATVHVRGKATIYVGGGPPAAASTNAAANAYLEKQLDLLSEHGERVLMDYTGEGGRPEPWKVADAPTNYLDIMRKSIIGIEIEITELVGKVKASQEMRAGDRAGVIKGFGQLGTDIGKAMSALVDEKDKAITAAKAAKAAGGAAAGAA
ncbi:transcriptional regulator [Sporothrix brasiliensis 5110]|uniref:Transcriptional regulator n=1 Tax=Sporothrix brasiliensis 5110 TaxID=1398154 RepID=A0A0C2FJD8_9PEZI|nr:transcriptional regulator [Sporothrix brasiliensis 5110]KIH91133.1 transcriptional regulator [Sporothrix brasiliensis 5110]